MKILVFSDSHRALLGMYQAIALHSPDQVIHLGDLHQDAEEVALAHPHIPFCTVPGNCDGWTTIPLKKQIVLMNKQILMSHGHIWNVKRSYDAALADAYASKSDILLFGHTHHSICRQMDGGLWMMNPGASPESYGLILLEDGIVQCSVFSQP